MKNSEDLELSIIDLMGRISVIESILVDKKLITLEDLQNKSKEISEKIIEILSKKADETPSK